MSTFRRLMGSLGIGVALLAGCGGQAGPGLDFPETVRVSRDAKANESGVEILAFESAYVLDERGGFVNTWHQRYRIVGPAGVEGWATVEARWQPWYMDKPEIRATITSPQGDKVDFDPKGLSESAAYPDAPDMYSDARVLRGPLPRIEVGAVVDEVIVTRSNRPYFGDGYTHYELLQGQVPREHVEVTIESPASRTLNYEVRDADVKVEDHTADGKRRLRFSGGPFTGIAWPPPMMPTDAPSWPSLVFSTGESWQSLAEAYSRVVEQKIPKDALVSAAKKAVNEADSPRVKADKLVDWLRKRVRYAGVELGDSAIVPRDPLETLKNAYGDCKDQAVLLVALLRAVDVPAHVALLRAGRGEDVRPGLPSLNVFNHAIVVVEGETPIWVDPTATYSRAGELPTADEDRLALIIQPSTTGLVRTPASKAADNRYEEVREIYFSPLGRGRVVETCSGTGHVGEYLRSSMEGSTEALRENLGKYIERQYFSKVLGALDVSPLDDLAAPVSIRIEAKDARVAVSQLLSAGVLIDSSALFQWVPLPLSDDSEPRKVDLVLSTPYESTLRYEVHPAEGFEVELTPERKVELGPALYTRKITKRADGGVDLTLTFQLPKARLTPDEVAAFRKAYAKLRTEGPEYLAVSHKSLRLKAARDSKAAVSMLVRAVEKSPKDAVASMRLAALLSDLGLGQSARSYAQRSVALDANTASLWFSFGDVHDVDLLGREKVEGYDRASVIRGYKEGVRLDPDNMSGRLFLAQAFETSSDGVRYGAGAELDQAIATYDAIDAEDLASFKDGEYAQNVLYALMYAGRIDELERRIETIERGQRPRFVSAVVAAIKGGAPAAVAVMDALGVSAEERVTPFTQASDALFRLRRYPESAALLDAALAIKADPALSALAESRRKMRPVDRAKLGMKTPADAVVTVLLTAGADMAAIRAQPRAFISPRALDGGTLLSALEGVGVGARVGGYTREVFTDMFMARVREASEVNGDDATGYRVTFETGPSSFLYGYVTKEADGYRVRALGENVSDIGCEAAHLAKAGDRAGAKQWLTWARSHTPSGALLSRDDALTLWTATYDVALGAAALCATGSQAKSMVGELEALRANAPAAQRGLYTRGLLLAHVFAGQLDAALTLAEELEKDPANKETGQILAATVLGALGRQQAALAKAQQMVRDGSDATLANELIARAEVALGHGKKGLEAMDAAVAAAKNPAAMDNNRAWLAVVAGNVREVDLASAERAVHRDATCLPCLHTLAMAYVEVGRIDDGREAFARLVAARFREQPIEVDWLVAGRIAEAFGLREEARTAYGKVQKPAIASGISSYALAQKRLSALK